jgi:hypothetical protein
MQYYEEISKKNLELLIEVLNALTNLVENDRKKIVIKDKGGIECIVGAMNDFQNNTDLLIKALGLLNKLTSIEALKHYIC